MAPVGSFRFGGFYDGQRRGFTTGMRVRYNERLAATISGSRDEVDVAGGSFNTNLVSLRVDSSFSTRMFLNAFVQYNSVTRQVISNIRYDFIHHPLSNLFVVYNETRSTGGMTTPPSRAVVVKLTQLLSF